MQDLKIFLFVFGVMSILLLVVATVFCLLLSYGNQTTCKDYQTDTGRQTKFAHNECYVMTGKGWFTMDEYKAIISSKGYIP